MRTALLLLFFLYYATGFFVSVFAIDKHGNPPPLWHVPLISLVWPALFFNK